MIKWRYIIEDHMAVDEALAEDEILMDEYVNWTENDFPEPTLRIYTIKNDSVLIGRFQNPEAEVDIDLCDKLNVPINRRMTGGGTVLMGPNQLMISISCSADHPIVPAHPAKILPKFAKGIVAGLSMMGIDAEYRPKNDIVVNGKKISGSAICIEKSGSFLYQATVLVDFDIPLMMRLLKLGKINPSDRTIDSFYERITTVNRELNKQFSMQNIRETICRGFELVFKMTAENIPITDYESNKIDDLTKNKYKDENWINQRIPDVDMVGESALRTAEGMIRVYVSLSSDIIKSVLITGDFISDYRLIKNIEAALKWSRSDREAIDRTIKTIIADEIDLNTKIFTEYLTDIIYEASVNAKMI